MRNLQMEDPKIHVNFFQRRPRKGFSFSVEYIFKDVRQRLAHKISSRVYICKCYNDGYYTKIINIMEAAFRKKADVNHITGEVHFLNLLMKKRNVILTILDCGVMPRKKGLIRKIVKWLYLSAPVKNSKYVTAISEVTKQEIIRYTGCDPDKIHVIPVAIDPLYSRFPKSFNKEKPEILHIGTGFNKNLVNLIKAIKGINCRLTIIGKLSDEYLLELEGNHIDYRSEYNISNERLLEKYKECDIVAFVSTFEGFGMPIIEGNTVERVVVTSNISSMPEVAADAACLVDPYDVESIRDGILKVISDDGYREELINNGKINKLRFGADAVAKMYYELYRKIK
jgi:glycosyltransferase involved in cell wall biosynthesis